MKLAGLALAASLATSAAVASPIGTYDVEGKGPEGGNYVGVASITRQGEAFRVEWVIARERFVGTAVGNDDFFAVAYRSGNSTGIAVYSRQPDGWLGVWTYTGGTRIGAERLIRR